jgi:hypothetical protein
MRTIIGLAGVKTSGKSTAANIIKELVEGAQEAALADKLKNTCAEVFGVPREYFDRQDLKEVPFQDGAKELTNGAIGAILESFGIYMSRREIDSTYDCIGMELPTPRKIAQIVGTEVLRAAGDEDIHCKNVNLTDGVTIISDLRFPNEFNYFCNNSDFNFVPLYIQRDEAEQYVTEDSHPSEKCVFQFSSKCKEINNNNSLENLRSQIVIALEENGLLSQTRNRA